jgi:hypothetical protein
MKKWYVITGILALLLIISLGSCSIKPAQVDDLEQRRSIATDALNRDLEFYKSECMELKAEIDAPQALVQITDMHFVWGEGKQGKIVGEVKNFGSVDAQEVFVRVMEYEGKYGEGFGDFVWVDYLRAGENKPFELKVAKPYCDDKYIPQIEFGFKTVGKYGHEWKSQIMHR